MSEEPDSEINVSETARRDELELELANSLRDTVNAFGVTHLGTEELVSAIELARRLRSRFVGTGRRRWYERQAGETGAGLVRQNGYLDTSPIRGALNPIAPPLELWNETRNDGSCVVVGQTRLGLNYEGPPHGVHGGWIAAIFDEVLGAAQGIDGSVRLTAILKVKYREITPIDEELRFEGWVAEKRGGRTVVKATCHARNRLTADAEGIFVSVDLNEIRQPTTDE